MHTRYAQHLGACLRLVRLSRDTGADWSAVIRYHASLAAHYLAEAK